jgi:hypothetical protein
VRSPSHSTRTRTPTATQPSLDAFLAEAPARYRKRCGICLNPVVSAALLDFYARKRAKTTSVTLGYLCEHYLIPTLGLRVTGFTVSRHVRLCMGIDVVTGEPKT